MLAPTYPSTNIRDVWKRRGLGPTGLTHSKKNASVSSERPQACGKPTVVQRFQLAALREPLKAALLKRRLDKQQRREARKALWETWSFRLLSIISIEVEHYLVVDVSTTTLQQGEVIFPVLLWNIYTIEYIRSLLCTTRKDRNHICIHKHGCWIYRHIY